MWQFLIIFLIVLLLYFHLQFHWKTSNELDVAHISVPNKDTLETVADFKQPFIMDRNSTSDILNPENGLSYKLNIMKDEKLLEIPHKVLLSTLANESGISLNNKKFLIFHKLVFVLQAYQHIFEHTFFLVDLDNLFF